MVQNVGLTCICPPGFTGFRCESRTCPSQSLSIAFFHPEMDTNLQIQIV